MNDTKNSSPDMVRYSDVIGVLTSYPKAFKDENALANIIYKISCLTKYDLKPVADNVTNNNTTVNVIAEEDKVRDFMAGLRNSLKR